MQETVAAALYPVLAATVNHSCNPNLVRFSVGDSILFMAAKNIKKGILQGSSGCGPDITLKLYQFRVQGGNDAVTADFSS